MKYLKVFWLILFLLTPLGCSQDNSGTENSQAPSIEDIEEEGRGSEEAEKQSGIPELTPEDQELAKKAPSGMVFIKGGCFLMGNNQTQEDEKWEHEVCLDSFYLDKYEVTQARWKSVMKYNPSKFVGDDLPVEQVNFNDIQKYIKKTNGACRLPTEAEWEYAARAGVDKRYYWGNLMDGAYAWFEDNSQKRTQPVGQKKPNAFGLYDMMGNVWEWTNDWYAVNYTRDKEINPTGPGNGDNKVIRGGSFDSSAGAMRITNRTWVHPQNRVYSKITSYGGIVNEIFNYIGFRCAQSIPKASSPQPQESSSN